MEPHIENMTLDEYREYEAEKERQLRDNVRSKDSPTRYKGTEFNSSHRDKSDVDLEKEDAQVEDDDDRNTYDIWDITVEDVERIKQFLTSLMKQTK
nr:hypothetical protein [Tanacetum cinerariifolium]